MVSTQFHSPYTQRNATTNKPPVMAFSNGTAEESKMYILSALSRDVAIIGPKIHLTMKVVLIYKKVDGALHQQVLLNSSHTKFASCMARPVLTQHFSMTISHPNVPDFC